MEKTGVILLNLGGPDNPGAVRPFLYNLFSDRDIIPFGPAFMQKPLAWLISGLRAKRTKEAYAQIGGASPILRITGQQADALREALMDEGDFSVYVGMRYWHPFIEESVKQACRNGIRRLIGLSLYPHYSRATTGSTREKFDRAAGEFGLASAFISSWYDHPLYIDALVETIKERLKGYETDGVHLLFSAHSLPVSFIEEGDPYVDEIKGTVEAIIRRLRTEMPVVPPYHISYQSRSGPVKWLGPSTDEVIIELSGKGVRRIVVVPVSFVSDHIETLYEIDILYRGLAEKNGTELRRVESLNTRPLFISALKDLVLRATEVFNET
ncbi:MAG TPA: ferrochelatase [Nitrospirae bacterium]|nr:ferrochelatase [Nitrospirota bacterium]